MENYRTHLSGYLQQELNHIRGPSESISTYITPTINLYHYSGTNYTVERK